MVWDVKITAPCTSKWIIRSSTAAHYYPQHSECSYSVPVTLPLVEYVNKHHSEDV